MRNLLDREEIIAYVFVICRHFFGIHRSHGTRSLPGELNKYGGCQREEGFVPIEFAQFSNKRHKRDKEYRNS